MLRNYVGLFALATPYFFIVALCRSLYNGGIYYTYPDTGEVISTYFTYAGLTEWVIHPAYLSLWAGTAFFIAGYYVTKDTKNILNWSALCSLLILVLMSQSRMNILALIFIIILLSVFVFFRKISVFKSFGLLSIVILFTGLLWSVLPNKVLGRFSDLTSFRYNIEAETFHEGFNGITIRLAEWKCALQEIKKRPFFGSGIGDARDHLEESYMRNKFIYGHREKFNAHNQFIETTLAVGVIGLASLIYIFIPTIYVSVRKSAWHIFAATGYVVLCFLTESYLERQWGVVFLGMMLPTLAESGIALQENSITTRNEF
ncbi:MAG: O-antigen ligase family protein [Thermaurantimonas sp.]